MLMTGLMKNSTITALDLSHNRITNHGARLLSRMLLEKTVLTSLNLSDNMVGLYPPTLYCLLARYMTRSEWVQLLLLHRRSTRRAVGTWPAGCGATTRSWT